MIQLAMTVDMPSLRGKWSKTTTAEIRLQLGEVMAIQTVIARRLRRDVLNGITVNRPKPWNNEEVRASRYMQAFMEWRAENPNGTKQEFDDSKDWKQPLPRYGIGDKYAALLGLKATSFKNSDEMHRLAGISGHPRGFASGGMWRGMQVRNFGSTGAMIDFGGSSIGASTGGTKRSRSRREAERGLLDKNGKRRVQGLVRNDQKAGTVFIQSRIGLLEMTQDQLTALESAWANHTGAVVDRIFNLSDPAYRTRLGDTRLWYEIENALLQSRHGIRRKPRSLFDEHT
jgi:hypothetical protein